MADGAQRGGAAVVAGQPGGVADARRLHQDRPVLHRLAGVLGGGASVCALAPHDLVVLLDGAGDADAGRAGALVGAALGPGVLVEHVGSVAGVPDALEVLRRAGASLAHRRARGLVPVARIGAPETFRSL